MDRYYIIDGLLVLLGIALVVTAIKYPKDVLVKLPLEILRLPFRGLWSLVSLPLGILAIPLIYLADKRKLKIPAGIQKLINLWLSDDDDKPYPCTKRLAVDFKNGKKYVKVLDSRKDEKEVIENMLEVLSGEYAIEEFKIAQKADQKIIQFPDNVNFFDFHLLVQHLSNELGEKKSFGVYKSGVLHYYVFQDNKTLNNLLGFTSEGKLFSIYMLDDLVREQHLKLNQKLKIDTGWIELIRNTNKE